MAETVTIPRRFRGPPDSANGGYACGIVAGLLGSGAAEVTLRRPPPLDRELAVWRGPGERVELRDRDELVAEGEPLARVAVEVPEPVSLEQARAACDASPMHEHHPYPECFVCGPGRGGDGLGIVCGPVEGRDLVAAPFETSRAVEEGPVPDELVWAALDCPSGIAEMLAPGAAVSVLGRLAGTIEAPLRGGESYVAIGWPIDRDGRKLRSGTAIFDADGELMGTASATWIELPPDA